ncbi:hypothetical protein B0F90DRAFT_1624765 [Multifurca ochricompacta]|uniref:Secreted protein n=1 Tax=Multifurca ochricompacta TaxID=376703 RepID=A0AAD4M910_9AGAM|nr:hypothetical protein B0F90DRAFT_1624765 [Multifurca ochricompacta]
MIRFAFVILLCSQAALGYVLRKRAVDFVDPTTGGGSWLDNAGSGGGEPLNVVISAQSSPNVLTDSGVLNYAKALGFSTECLGIHIGGPQSANLGDGNGSVNQTVELREDFGSSIFGTCLESAAGGNHFRVFRQNGPTANTGALFLAVSQEEDVTKGHTISPDGYDVGRDKLVNSAIGKKSFGGVTYSTTEQDLTGFLQSGSAGINHGIAIDGVVKLLTVTIV